jgi:uncharacterized membrane protein
MQLVVLYVTTAVAFLAIDLIGLKYLVAPLFRQHVGELMADPVRWAPALVFYFGYVAGILFFVSAPALASGAGGGGVLVKAALLGLFAYGTYELTNYATLKDWALPMVLADGLWGAFVTGVAAWAGLAITRALA